MLAVLRFVRSALMEFGALIVFFAALYSAGIKPAFAAACSSSLSMVHTGFGSDYRLLAFTF